MEHASERIQSLILNAPFPSDLETEIRTAFSTLNAPYVAVRSSATAEDGADHAWAGQLDSYLNTTEATLLKNVQRCWASLFTPRAIFYRFEKDLHTTHISVAVVVQKMVASEVSGIAFSVHPVTEDRNQLIIEAGFGLGEAIVSGSVTPDSYVVEKTPRNILDVNVSTQTRALYRASGGGNEWKDIPEPQASSQVLNQQQILELSEIILTIERHYGFPCDIEWAYEQNTFYIVQSRPITTLSKRAEDITSPFVSPELKDFNPDEYHWDGLWKNDLFATCFWQDCWVPEVAAEMNLNLQGVGVMNLKGGNFFVHKPTRAKVDAQVKEMIDKENAAFFRNMVTVSDKIFEWGIAKGEYLRKEEPTLEHFRDFVQTAKKMNFLWLIGATYVNWPVQEKLQEVVIEDGFPAEHVMDVIPKIDTPLHHYQSGLIELKKAIGKKSFAEVEADPALFEQLKAHAEKYVWIEISNFIGEPMTPERLYNQVQHLEKDSEHDHSAFVPNKPLSEKMQFVLECMHDVGYVKQGGAEYFSIFSEKTLPFLRAVAEKIGITYRELMCLSTSEIEWALQGTLSAEALKQRVGKRIGVNDWAVIGDESGNMLYVDEPNDIARLIEKMIPRAGEGTKELVGQTGNRGTYTGPVRVVMNTYDFGKMQTGDVLVTTMTTPDFVVLMQKSGAIVTDIGGLLCHAAIMSRELKKPCIIGTKFATQILKDGDLVEVDADSGVVRIVESATEEESVDEWQTIAQDFNSPYIKHFIFVTALSLYRDELNLPKLLIAMKGENGAMQAFARLSSWEAAHKVLAERAKNDPNYIERELIDKTNKLGEEFNEWSEREIFEADLSKKSEHELVVLYYAFVEKQARMYAYGITLPTLDFGSFAYVEGNLERILKAKVPSEKYSAYYSILTEPIENSFAQDQEFALLSLMDRYYSDQWKQDVISGTTNLQQEYPEFWKDLAAHTRTYAWVYYVYTGPAFTEQNFLDFIVQELHADERPGKKLERLQQKRKETLIRREQYIRDLKSDVLEENILRLAGKMVWAKPRRKDYQSKSYYHLEKLQREIGRRISATLDEVRHTPIKDLEKCLNGEKFNAEKARAIKALHSVIPKENDSIELVYGDDTQDFLKTVRTEKPGPQGEEVRGNTAYKGKVQGRVRIINAPQDMEKMQKGDVLVSVATTPSIVPAMKKAAAIVADEGGLTCHAAIVSRELEIPCVVGTKFATQVLKDGDLVEVDADKGVVTILERAN